MNKIKGIIPSIIPKGINAIVFILIPFLDFSDFLEYRYYKVLYFISISELLSTGLFPTSIFFLKKKNLTKNSILLTISIFFIISLIIKPEYQFSFILISIFLTKVSSAYFLNNGKYFLSSFIYPLGNSFILIEYIFNGSVYGAIILIITSAICIPSGNKNQFKLVFKFWINILPQYLLGKSISEFGVIYLNYFEHFNFIRNNQVSFRITRIISFIPNSINLLSLKSKINTSQKNNVLEQLKNEKKIYLIILIFMIILIMGFRFILIDKIPLLAILSNHEILVYSIAVFLSTLTLPELSKLNMTLNNKTFIFYLSAIPVFVLLVYIFDLFLFNKNLVLGYSIVIVNIFLFFMVKMAFDKKYNN